MIENFVIFLRIALPLFEYLRPFGLHYLGISGYGGKQ